MEYLLNKDGRYYYNRRVPHIFREIDPRTMIRIALKTDSRKEAAKLAMLQNEHVEKYWKLLIEKGQTYSDVKFIDVVKNTRLAAFHSTTELNHHPFVADQKIEGQPDKRNLRLTKDFQHSLSVFNITLDDALMRFWDYSKDRVMNKSPNQTRKWRLPRKRAIKNFIKCVGNKSLTEINRDDTLKFRDWWINRIEEESLVTNSANKDIIHVKTIIETVSDNLKLGLDISYLFKKLRLAEDDEKRRLPFESSFITSTLLNPQNLSGLNEQAKWVLYAVAETGAGLSEQLGLLPEDIVLDAEIPYISIVPRLKKPLKTKYRKRIIPLVGYALDAFKACPNGFTNYRDRPDALSSILGKYLSENNLLPSEQHTVYSLRHSFQDRILAAKTPDRIQAELMGHKFHRPSYGDGSTLKHKFDCMKKVQLKRE